MRYEFEIEDDTKDFFEDDADNVMEVRVYNKKGDDITKDTVVELFMSRNALLGLGTELIRLAYKFREGKHAHLEPVNEEQQIQRMGVFLTPSSGELIICCNEGECIDEYLKSK